MKIQVFDGGVNSRIAPQLLQQNQGIIYDNIDNATGILTPVKDKLDTGINTDKYAAFFHKGDAWLSSDAPTDYVEFQGFMYSTDGVAPKKFRNGVTQNLGIAAPTFKPVVTVQDAAEPILELSYNYTLGGNLPNGVLKYRLFNVKNNVYSAPLQLEVDSVGTVRASLEDVNRKELYEPVVTKTLQRNNAIEFGNIQGQVADRLELYRNYQGVWRKLTENVEGFVDDVEDISANPALDIDRVSPFVGTYQHLYTFYNADDGTESAPSPLSDELEVNSGLLTITLPGSAPDPQVTHVRIYRVGNNIAQFTLVRQLDISITSYTNKLRDSELDGTLLESDNYAQAPSGLKCLSESYAMLFGALGSTLRFTPVAKPNAWPPEYSLEFDDDITGLGPVANGLIVMTRSATYIVTGTGPFTLAQQTLRGDNGCIANSSVQKIREGALIWAGDDGLYTSSGNNAQCITKSILGDIRLAPVSSAVIDEVYYLLNEDGRILAMDFRYGGIAKWLDLGVESLAVARGELYGWAEGKLHKLFQSDNFLPFKYKSPRFIEGASTELKTYKKVYFRIEGDIIINILIDDESVFSKAYQVTRETVVAQIPQDLQRGYYIQFEVSGTGSLLEIEYEAGRRPHG